MTTYTLTLLGAVPSKKNNYRRSGKGGLFIDQKTADALAPLQLQAQAKWKHPKLENPEVEISFFCSTDAIDRDGMTVSILDLLQKAGVLRNDNVRHFNGRLVIHPAVLCKRGEERTDIRLTVRNQTAGTYSHPAIASMGTGPPAA